MLASYTIEDGIKLCAKQRDDSLRESLAFWSRLLRKKDGYVLSKFAMGMIADSIDDARVQLGHTARER
jgi:hypothetical protein